MVDIIADLVPLYGVILIIAIWWFGSYLIGKQCSKDLELLELHDIIKIKLGEELNVPKEEILEMWFDRNSRYVKGTYVVDNEKFNHHMFTVTYIIRKDSHEIETFKKVQKEVADF